MWRATGRAAGEKRGARVVLEERVNVDGLVLDLRAPEASVVARPRAPLADATVVVPTAGRPALCRAAVASALAQTCGPRQVVVVVDGDPAGYDDLEAQLGDDRVVVLRSSGRRGPGHARNLGIAHATTRYVAFLDDDDVWLPEKLERQLEAIERRGIASREVVSSTSVLAVGPGRRVDRWPARDPRPGESPAAFLTGLGPRPYGGRVLQTSTLLASTELAAEIGMRGNAYEDWDWLIRAAHRATWVHVAQPLSLYHRSSGSLGSSTTLDDAARWLEGLEGVLSPAEYSAACLTVLARAAARTGGVGDAVRLLGRALGARPNLRLVAQFPLRVARHRPGVG